MFDIFCFHYPVNIYKAVIERWSEVLQNFSSTK